MTYPDEWNHPKGDGKMTLDEAWKERLRLIQAAAVHRRKASDLEKDRFSSPRSCAIGVWYSAISVHYDIQFERHKMDLALWEADSVWHDAVTTAKGNIKVTWEEIPDKGYKCILETGEVFEP